MEKGVHDEILDLLRLKSRYPVWIKWVLSRKFPEHEIEQAIGWLEEEGFIARNKKHKLKLTNPDVPTKQAFQESTKKRSIDHFYRVGDDIDVLQNDLLVPVMIMTERWNRIDDSPYINLIRQKCVELEDLALKYHNSARKSNMIYYLLRHLRLRRQQMSLKRRRRRRH